MAPKTAKQAQKSERIEMRVTPEEDALLRTAADLAHVSKTAFILSAAAERAMQVVQRAHMYPLSAETFERFLAELDARPATAVPAMVELFRSEAT